MSGIQNSLQVMADLQLIAIDVIGLVKNHSLIQILKQIGPISAAAKDIVKEGPLALPELKSLGPDDVAALSKAAYLLVQAVVAQIAK